jgi:hypothetical protein
LKRKSIRSSVERALEIGQAAGFVEHALEQLGDLGVPRYGRQPLAQGGERTVDVTGFLAPARHLVKQGGGALGTVLADPVRVGIHAGQRLQRLVVARTQPHDLADALGGTLQIAELLRQHPSQAQ